MAHQFKNETMHFQFAEAFYVSQLGFRTGGYSPTPNSCMYHYDFQAYFTHHY